MCVNVVSDGTIIVVYKINRNDRDYNIISATDVPPSIATTSDARSDNIVEENHVAPSATAHTINSTASTTADDKTPTQHEQPTEKQTMQSTSNTTSPAQRASTQHHENAPHDDGYTRDQQSYKACKAQQQKEYAEARMLHESRATATSAPRYPGASASSHRPRATQKTSNKPTACPTIEESASAPKRQFLIIEHDPPPTCNNLQQFERDLAGKAIMPNRQDIDWPTPETIAKSQQRLPAKTKRASKKEKFGDQHLYVNSQGKIIIPNNDINMQHALITLAHQDNHAHRSIQDTIHRLAQKFTFANLIKKTTEFTHTCLQCLKINGGKLTPRPLWHMLHATRPFELIHSDWMDMPDAHNGHKYLLIIIDDLSGTVLLHSSDKHTAYITAKIIVEHWLSCYPDPTMLNTDGGTHYKNTLFEAIANIRGFTHHITAPHAKWSHGVGERINRRCLNSLLAILGQLEVDESTWSSYIKMVQAQINRTKMRTRGNKSPIEITTGLPTKSTFDHVLFTQHKASIATATPVKSELIQAHIDEFISGLEQTWGTAAKARAKRAQHNRARRRKLPTTIPHLEIGDFVLVAEPVRGSKLCYKWVGPMRIEGTTSRYVYKCKPVSRRALKIRDVHISRIRRFAGKLLNVTEQLQHAIDRDFPTNEVQQIVAHKTNHADGELHLLVQ